MSYGLGCFIVCENGNEKWGFLSETKQRQTANVENGGKTIITRLFLPFASVVRSSFRLCFLGLGSSLCCSFAFGISRIWWFVQSFVRPFPGLLVRFCIGLGFCRSFWVACGGRSFWGSCGGCSVWVPSWRSFVLRLRFGLSSVCLFWVLVVCYDKEPEKLWAQDCIRAVKAFVSFCTFLLCFCFPTNALINWTPYLTKIPTFPPP